MSYQFPASDKPVRKPLKVSFGIFSPQEFINYSQIKIEYSDDFEDKDLKIGGLSDPRLGCIERNMECATCGENTNNCPGHFGYIELETPVYHIGFIKYVKKILECVCHKCARFRLLETDPKYKRLLHVKNRLDYAHEHAKSKIVCEHPDCEEQLKPIRREKGVYLYFDLKKIDKRAPREPLPPEQARRILEKMSDETCRLIGLDPVNARPEWMILTVLPVPPPSVRPSVHMDLTSKGEDDLTHMLTNIIRYNNLVKKHENSRIIADYKEQLQLHVTSYIDNEVAGVSPCLQKGGRPIKSISARLKGKEGRIRCHLMGKRVDFSARTVITGDPHISIGEVGVPKSIARTLTFPETVSRFNIERLQGLVENSPQYPGAKYVTQNNGERRWDLTKMKATLKKPTLKYGDIVERHMVTGDLVLFNRQPTLHKMSMMSHRAVVMDYSTFRLNVNVCASYNADFDGDEMNLHMPQTLSSVAELETLTTVSNLLVSPQANKPVNALVQDALCGIRQFTKRDTFINKATLMNLLLWIGDTTYFGESKTRESTAWTRIPQPAIFKPEPLWTGKQLISLLLPRIDLVGYHSTHSDKQDLWKAQLESSGLDESAQKKEQYIFDNLTPFDTKVVIDDGELISGIICKKTVGASAGGIVHVIWRDYGPEAAREFLDNAALLVNQWLLHVGFSVGLGDSILPESTIHRIREHVDEQYRKVDALLELNHQGKLVSAGNLTLEETKEAQIINFLASARDGAGKMANTDFPSFNNLKQMVEAGSKGSILNISQIAAGVGQQIVDGRRIPYGFRNRTLPHFAQYDDGPESRGFVRNSFVSGLTPNEMFNHAMGGREGLIDTAVKTAETGYIQRRLIKALEDLSIKYDGSARNSRGDVVQFYYGDDGFDGTAIESQVFPTMMLSDEKFKKDFYVEELGSTEWKLLWKDRDYLRETMRLAEDKWPLPLNLKRMIIRSGKGGYDGTYDKLQVSSAKPLTYREVYNRVFELRKRLRPSKLNLCSSEHPSSLFGILLSSTLSSKQIVDKLKLSRTSFEWLLREIEKKYHLGLIHPGESVGVIAAQSIGEPATQMTLNTFHQSGTGNKAVTSGIPRLKEIINAAKNLKTPSMTIYLEEEIRMDKLAVKKLCAQLEQTLLEDVVSQYAVIYDPDYRNSNIVEDRVWLDIVNGFPNEDAPDPQSLHPWIIRLVLSRDTMTKKLLSIHQVTDALMEVFEDDFYELHSSDNSEQLVIHLRPYKDEEESQSFEESRETLQDLIEGKPIGYGKFLEITLSNLLQCIMVSGVPGIDKAFISQQTINEYDESGLVQDKKEYIIETDGINMKGCLGIEGVDDSRIYCNDPQEMLSLFGVEISHATFLTEIRSVIETGGSYINYRHLSLLADVVTNRGSLMQITRHGIKRTEAGPLMKCTFEQTVDVLNDAAVNGECDNVKGVAEHIMLGQIAPIGTGMMDILLQESRLNEISQSELEINAIILRGEKVHEVRAKETEHAKELESRRLTEIVDDARTIANATGLPVYSYTKPSQLDGNETDRISSPSAAPRGKVDKGKGKVPVKNDSQSGELRNYFKMKNEHANPLVQDEIKERKKPVRKQNFQPTNEMDNGGNGEGSSSGYSPLRPSYLRK